MKTSYPSEYLHFSDHYLERSPQTFRERLSEYLEKVNSSLEGLPSAMELFKESLTDIDQLRTSTLPATQAYLVVGELTLRISEISRNCAILEHLLPEISDITVELGTSRQQRGLVGVAPVSIMHVSSLFSGLLQLTPLSDHC